MRLSNRWAEGSLVGPEAKSTRGTHGLLGTASPRCSCRVIVSDNVLESVHIFIYAENEGYMGAWSFDSYMSYLSDGFRNG